MITFLCIFFVKFANQKKFLHSVSWRAICKAIHIQYCTQFYFQNFSSRLFVVCWQPCKHQKYLWMFCWMARPQPCILYNLLRTNMISLYFQTYLLSFVVTLDDHDCQNVWMMFLYFTEKVIIKWKQKRRKSSNKTYRRKRQSKYMWLDVKSSVNQHFKWHCLK